MSPFRYFAFAALFLAVAAPAFAKSPARVRLLSSPNPSNVGQAVKLLAEVDGLGGGAPTGTVSFAKGSVAIGNGALSPYGAGQATLAASALHSCALTATGGVACWGYNAMGQLGDGTTAMRKTPVAVSGLSSGVVAVAAGDHHTCALTSAGAVKCWGDNRRGALGDGTTEERHIPVAVSGLSSGVIAIAAGSSKYGDGYTCALTSAGAVKCWGANGGALGDGTALDRLTPVAVMGLSKGIIGITAGDPTCALTSAGAVKCWGRNDHGQLGDGTTTSPLKPVSVSGLSSGVVAVSSGREAGAYAHTCALTSAGAVKCWGWNHYGQLGDGTTTDRHAPVSVSGLSNGVVAVAAGGGHSCALTNAGAVECWGWNLAGQLGDGRTSTNHLTPVAVTGLSSGVVAIAVGGTNYGGDHTCAQTIAGGVMCWGYGEFGQLGDGLGSWFHDYSSTPTTVSGLTGLIRTRASLSTSALGVGAHYLRAGFGGDAAHTSFIGTVIHIVK